MARGFSTQRSCEIIVIDALVTLAYSSLSQHPQGLSLGESVMAGSMNGCRGWKSIATTVPLRRASDNLDNSEWHDHGILPFLHSAIVLFQHSNIRI